MKRTNRIFTLLIAAALVIGALAFGTVTAFAASGDVTDAKFVPKGINGAARDMLSWASVEGAASYGVTVHLASDGTEIARTSTTTNSVSAADLLQDQEGTFYFTVVALNGILPMGQGATSANFTYPVRVQVGQVTLYDGEYTKDGTSKSTLEPAGMSYAHYENGVLTLNSFSYSGAGDNDAVIYATEDIEIRLLNNNQITPSVFSAIFAEKTLAFYGGGELEIFHTASPANSIWTFGNMSVQDVSLYIQSEGTGIDTSTLTLKNANINIGSKEYGICSNATKITDSALLLSSLEASCIFAAGGDIEIENSTVSASGFVCLNANRTHNIKFISGTLRLTGTSTLHGAIYTQESKLILPTVDYWWRTSKDGAASAFIKSTEQAFTYGYQGYIEIATTQPHEYYYELVSSEFIERCRTCDHEATAEILQDFRDCEYNGSAFALTIVYSDNWARERPTEFTYDGPHGSTSECINPGDYFASITVGDVHFESVFTIRKRSLKIMANDHTIVYGDVPGDAGIDCHGFAPGEDESVLTGALTFSFDYKQNDPVGDQYTITPGGYSSDNYDILYSSGKLRVVAATPTISAPPTASGVVFGSTLSASALTGGEASVPGKFTWKDGTEVLSTAGTVQKTAVFTPEDDTNYHTVEFTVDVAVSDCDHSASTTPPSCANPVTCSVCGSTIEMIDHEYRWIIDKEATETEDGFKHEECACGETRSENTVIPKTGTEQPTEPKPSDNIFLQILLMILGLILSFAAVIIIL